MYMRPPSSPPRNRTHDQKHQKKKGSYSCRTKPNKLKSISPLPDFRLNLVHHLVKYEREHSRADKSSAGSDHTSINKHHTVCHLNPTIATRRPDAKIKKKRGGVEHSVSAVCWRNQHQNQDYSDNEVYPLHYQYSKPIQFKWRRVRGKECLLCLTKSLRLRQIELGIFLSLNPMGSNPNRQVSLSMLPCSSTLLSLNKDVAMSRWKISNVQRGRERVQNSL